MFGYNSFDHSCYISLYDMARGELEREDTFWDPHSPVEYADRAAYHRGKELVVVGVSDGRVLVWDCQQKVSSQLPTRAEREVGSMYSAIRSSAALDIVPVRESISGQPSVNAKTVWQA